MRCAYCCSMLRTVGISLVFIGLLILGSRVRVPPLSLAFYQVKHWSACDQFEES
jgi:hypothetical protein